MAVKIHVLFTMLVFAGVVPPLAHAQFNIASILASLTGTASASGVVPCSVGNSISLSTSVFPNATAQLRCNNNVVGSTTTDTKGAFTIVIALPVALQSNLPGSCNIFVATPLVTCNASLSPVGNLVAPVVGIVNTTVSNVIKLVLGNFGLL